MMQEIALHILDVTQNSVRAGAAVIKITVEIQTGKDTLEIMIGDDGCGMEEHEILKVQDPFYTTRTTRKVGLGIPFFKQAALGTGGTFSMESKKGKGTSVKAAFRLSHIDRMPLGDLNETIYTLITFHPQVRFVYTYCYDGKSFVLDTQEIKEILGDIPFGTREVSDFLKEYLKANKEEADGGAEV